MLLDTKCFVLSSVSRAASPSPQSVRRVSSSRSVSGSPEPAAKKPPAPQSPVQSQSPSTNWSPAVPVKKAKSPTPSPSPARVCVCPILGFIIVCGHWEAKTSYYLFATQGSIIFCSSAGLQGSMKLSGGGYTTVHASYSTHPLIDTMSDTFKFSHLSG